MTSNQNKSKFRENFLNKNIILGSVSVKDRKNSVFSLTISPFRNGNEDSNSMLDTNLTPSTSSTTPLGGFFSNSCKYEYSVSSDSNFRKISQKIPPIEISRKSNKSVHNKLANSKFAYAIESVLEIENERNQSIFQLSQDNSESKIDKSEIQKKIIMGSKKSFREDNMDEKGYLNPNEFDEDGKNLTNCQDIIDFHEYTQQCIKTLKNIKQGKSLPQTKFKIQENHLKVIKNGEKKLAVFDLDGTLIQREFTNYKNCDKVIEISLPKNKTVQIGINIRPHLMETLIQISKKYILVVFTAGQQIYADKVLELIDPINNFFSYRLYRDSCKTASLDDETIYIKDLSIFEDIPLEKIVIIDDSVLSFCNHIENGIPILPFYNNKDDTELLDLIKYLNHLYNVDDIRKENKKKIGLRNHSSNSISYSISSASLFDEEDSDESYGDSIMLSRENENKSNKLDYFTNTSNSKKSNYTNSEWSESDCFSYSKKFNEIIESEKNIEGKDRMYIRKNNIKL